MMKKKIKPCYSLQIGFGIMVIYLAIRPISFINIKCISMVIEFIALICFLVVTFMNFYLEEKINE